MNKPDFQIIAREGTYFSYNHSPGICYPGFREKSNKIQTHTRTFVTQIIADDGSLFIRGDYVHIPEEDLRGGKVEELLREYFWLTNPDISHSGVSDNVPSPNFFKKEANKMIDDLLSARWELGVDLSSISSGENDFRILRAFNGFKK